MSVMCARVTMQAHVGVINVNGAQSAPCRIYNRECETCR
jgi:hypothetical protein